MHFSQKILKSPILYSDVPYGSNSKYAYNCFLILFDYLSFFGLVNNSRSEPILEKNEKLFVLIIYI